MTIRAEQKEEEMTTSADEKLSDPKSLEYDAGPDPVHPGLTQWLLTGERGVSSNAIVCLALGSKFDVFGNRTPSDAGDLRRCLLLLEAVPTLKPYLTTVVANSSPEWKRMVGCWDILTEIFTEAIPDYLSSNPGWSSPEHNKKFRDTGYDLMYYCNN